MAKDISFTRDELQRIANDSQLRNLLERGERQAVKNRLQIRGGSGGASASSTPSRPPSSQPQRKMGVLDRVTEALRGANNKANKRK